LVAATYHWKHSWILELTARQFFAYYNQISVIEARQQLYAFEASSFPEMKKQDRRQIQKRYDRALTPVDEAPDPREVEATWEFLRARRRKQKVKKDA